MSALLGEARRKIRSVIGPYVLVKTRNIVAHRSWTETQALGARLGALGRCLSSHRFRLACENLRVVFGETKTHEEIAALALESLRSVGRLGAESLRLPSMSPEEISEVCPIEGIEHIQAAIDEGHGAVLPTPHLGNWEIVAVNLINKGYPVVALSRASRDQRIAKTITGVRKEMHFPTIAVENGIRPCLRTLQDNHVLAILPDRRAKGQGLTVNYLGRRVCIWHTPILLAMRTGAKVIISHCPRQSDGRIHGIFDPPMDLQITDDRDDDMLVNTQRMMSRFEEIVHQYPAQYMWQYDIFRDAQPISKTTTG